MIFALSLAHKYFTLKVSLILYLTVKIGEIMFFYYYSLYLQNNDCTTFSTLVHFIFDLTIYNLLLDFMHALSFNDEEFRFEVGRRNPKEDIRAKIVFNITLLCISYISSVQFKSAFASFFLYLHSFLLVMRLLQLCVRD